MIRNIKAKQLLKSQMSTFLLSMALTLCSNKKWPCRVHLRHEYYRTNLMARKIKLLRIATSVNNRSIIILARVWRRRQVQRTHFSTNLQWVRCQTFGRNTDETSTKLSRNLVEVSCLHPREQVMQVMPKHSHFHGKTTWCSSTNITSRSSCNWCRIKLTNIRRSWLVSSSS